jgi:hypothetical protein
MEAGRRAEREHRLDGERLDGAWTAAARLVLPAQLHAHYRQLVAVQQLTWTADPFPEPAAPPAEPEGKQQQQKKNKKNKQKKKEQITS